MVKESQPLPRTQSIDRTRSRTIGKPKGKKRKQARRIYGKQGKKRRAKKGGRMDDEKRGKGGGEDPAIVRK